jgi:hypothetical protein
MEATPVKLASEYGSERPQSRMQTLLQNSRISRHPKAYYKNIEDTADVLENDDDSDEELSFGSGPK